MTATETLEIATANELIVRRLYREACCEPTHQMLPEALPYAVWSRPTADARRDLMATGMVTCRLIGMGQTPAEAWKAAADRLCGV